MFSLSVKAGWKGTISGLDGLGWIVLAIVIFGAWNPVRAALGAYLFGFLQWLSVVLQPDLQGIPSQVLQVAPFPLMILTLLLVNIGNAEWVERVLASLPEADRDEWWPACSVAAGGPTAQSGDTLRAGLSASAVAARLFVHLYMRTGRNLGHLDRHLRGPLLLSSHRPAERADRQRWTGSDSRGGERAMRRMTMFWGCTIPARFPFIEKSTRLALRELGVEPVDAGGLHLLPRDDPGQSRRRRGLLPHGRPQSGPGRAPGLPLLTPCNGCYSTFKSVLSDLKVDWRLQREHQPAPGRRAGSHFSGDVDVWHLVEWLSEDLGPAALSKRVVKPLWGMKIAVHYGCHLLRPSPAVRWDSPTAPTKFEQLVRALGATVVDYETKMDCCGNALDRVGERQASLDMLRAQARRRPRAGGGRPGGLVPLVLPAVRPEPGRPSCAAPAEPACPSSTSRS